MNLSRKPVHFIVALIAGASFMVPSYAQQTAAKAPIKIGVLLPITGTWALASKDVQDGHALYLEKIGGAVAGHKIELIVEDNEGKGDVTITKARKLIEKDNVDLVAGLISSGNCYAVAPYLAEKKVLTIITGNCGAEGLTKNPKLRSPYIWRTTQSAGMLAYPMAEYLLKNNMKRVAIVFSAYAGGFDVVDGFARPFIEGGGTIIQEIYPALGTTDFGPFMAQIKQDADALVTFIVGTDGLRFAQQYSEYGLKAKLPLMDIGEVIVGGPNLIQLKDAAVGVISSIHYAQDTNSPENKDFVKRFEAKYKDRLLSSEVAGGYTGMHIITSALQAVGGNVKDTQKLRAALKALHITTAKGSFSFDAHQNVVEDFYIKRVEKTADGKYVYKTLYKVPKVSQFWKWKPEDDLKFPYGKLHGKYTNINNTQLQALVKSASM